MAILFSIGLTMMCVSHGNNTTKTHEPKAPFVPFECFVHAENAGEITEQIQSPKWFVHRKRSPPVRYNFGCM